MLLKTYKVWSDSHLLHGNEQFSRFFPLIIAKRDGFMVKLQIMQQLTTLVS